MPLEHTVRRFLLCLALSLPALLPVAQADSVPATPTVIPDLPAEEQSPELRQQQRLEREAASPALREHKNELLEQCWQMVERQSRNIGPVHILSVNIIAEPQVFINGRFVEPDANMQPQPHRYECQVSAKLDGVEKLTVFDAGS